MSKAAIIFPVVFGVVAVGATAGLDYYKKRALSENPDYSISEYLTDAAGSFKAQAKEVAANRTMTDYLGGEPEGWSKRAFVPSDIDILRPAPAKSAQAEGHVIDPKAAAVLNTVERYNARGMQVGGNTFEKDGTTVIVQGTFLPARIMTGFGGKQMGMMADMMNGAGLGENFAIVRGLKFVEPWDQRDKLPYRRFAASLNAQIQLSVMTNAKSDEEVMEVLSTIDVASLNRMLADPIPGMGENDILLLASAENGDAAQTEALAAVADHLKAAEAAAAEVTTPVSDDDTGDAPAGRSFADRLSALLGSGDSAEADEAETPKRMVCVVQQGFKRCSFPSQD